VPFGVVLLNAAERLALIRLARQSFVEPIDSTMEEVPIEVTTNNLILSYELRTKTVQNSSKFFSANFSFSIICCFLLVTNAFFYIYIIRNNILYAKKGFQCFPILNISSYKQLITL
jgi:hypothetical protein